MSEEEGKDNPLPNLIHREALGIKYNSRKSGGGALRRLCVKKGTLHLAHLRVGRILLSFFEISTSFLR